MRIIHKVDSSTTKSAGDLFTINGITTIVTYVEEGETAKLLTLLVQGESEIRLPFSYSSKVPSKVGLDDSGNIALTASPTIGVLRPSPLDENGEPSPRNVGDLHGCLWFGGSQ